LSKYIGAGRWLSCATGICKSNRTVEHSGSISVGTINKICTRKHSPSDRHKNIIVRVLIIYLKKEKYSIISIFKKTLTLRFYL
jgi:hypothetical protein